MIVEDIEYWTTLVPNMSCGTGYSEPDEFIVHFKGDIPSEYVYIDTWYCPRDMIENRFYIDMKWKFGDKIENMDEAFEMYKKALKEGKR